MLMIVIVMGDRSAKNLGEVIIIATRVDTLTLFPTGIEFDQCIPLTLSLFV